MAEMGSTSYIIPLRSESDEEYEPIESQPETIAFQNRVAPASTPETNAVPIRSIQSRSPLFRAKSREYDKSLSETSETTAAITTVVNTTISSTEMFIHNESGTAKIKRSIFGNKSNSAGTSASGSTRPSKLKRSTSAKSTRKSKWPMLLHILAYSKSFRFIIGLLSQGSIDKVESKINNDKSHPDHEEDVVAQQSVTSRNSPEIISHM